MTASRRNAESSDRQPAVTLLMKCLFFMRVCQGFKSPAKMFSGKVAAMAFSEL